MPAESAVLGVARVCQRTGCNDRYLVDIVTRIRLRHIQNKIHRASWGVSRSGQGRERGGRLRQKRMCDGHALFGCARRSSQKISCELQSAWYVHTPLHPTHQTHLNGVALIQNITDLHTDVGVGTADACSSSSSNTSASYSTAGSLLPLLLLSQNYTRLQCCDTKVQGAGS